MFGGLRLIAQQPQIPGRRTQASDTRRNPREPGVGIRQSANHPSITGSSVRWIAALRLTPFVSDSRCRNAPFGSW